MNTKRRAQNYAQWKLPEEANPRDIRFSPDSTRLAIVSDCRIWIYDAHAGDELSLLSGPTGNITDIVFRPDSGTLLSGGADSTIRLWNVNTGQQLKTLIGHTSNFRSNFRRVTFSPDGQTFVCESKGGINGWA